MAAILNKSVLLLALLATLSLGQDILQIQVKVDTEESIDAIDPGSHIQVR